MAARRGVETEHPCPVLSSCTHWRSGTGTAEKQNVSVEVFQFESAQAIVVVSQRLRKLYVARREFCCERVRIGDVEVGVPAGAAFFAISLVVRQWVYTDVLEHDHRGPPLDNAKKDVVRVGPMKRDVEPETVAIERQRGGDIPDDEEWRDAGNVWFGHVSSRRRYSR